MQIHQIKSEKKEIRFGDKMRSCAVLNRGDHPVYVEIDHQRVTVQAGAQFMCSSCSTDRIQVECEQDGMVEVGFWPHPQTMWVVKELDEVAHQRGKVTDQNNQEDEGIAYLLRAKVTREKLVDLEPEATEKESVMTKIKRKLTGK